MAAERISMDSNIKWQEWRERAACLDVDPELFFPLSVADPCIEDAIKVCQRCPVMSECLEHATNERAIVGVWGGQLFNKKWGTK